MKQIILVLFFSLLLSSCAQFRADFNKYYAEAYSKITAHRRVQASEESSGRIIYRIEPGDKYWGDKERGVKIVREGETNTGRIMYRIEPGGMYIGDEERGVKSIYEYNAR